MKFTVTHELPVLIKTIRTQNGISAKDLALHVKKSPSYISKLENGDIKNIQENDLTEILLFINNNKDFYEDVLPNVMRVLDTFLEPDRLPEQAWLIQYDVVERRATVSEEMAADLKKRMESLGLTPRQLADIVNRNLDTELSPAFPANEILALEHGGRTRLSIRLEMSEKDIRDILYGKDLNTTYMTVNALSFLLLKLEKFGIEAPKMPPEQAIEVLRDTAAYLEKYQVHSLTGFSHMLSSNSFIDRQRALVSSFGSIGAELITDILDFFQEALKYDTLNATQALDGFSRNCAWDPSFMMKLIGLPFYKMESLGYLQKKKLIDEILSLLDRYDHISDFEKKIEIY